MPIRAALLIAAVLAASPANAATKPADAAEAVEKIALGERVPDFTVTDLDGKSWKFSELHGKAGMKKRGPVVLTFWCSFCHSCRHVEQHLDELAKKYKGRAAVIALDASANDTAEAAAEVAEEKGLTLPVVLEPKGNTADLFDTKVTTTTVVIDRDGVLRYCGRFGDGKQAFAEDALKAVLDGKDVRVASTPHRG